MIKTLVLSALVALTATASVAGGFTPVVAQPVPVVVAEPAAVEQPLGAEVLVPLAILGALLYVAVSEADDDDTNSAGAE